MFVSIHSYRKVQRMFNDGLVLLALGAVALLLPLSSAYRTTTTVQFLHWAGAQVPAEQKAALERRLSRRSQGMGMGILAAGVLALVLSQVWERADEAAGGLFFLALLFVMGAAGLVLADILWPGDVADGARTARAKTPTLKDYVTPVSLRLSRLIVTIGLVALAGTLLLGLTRWFDAPTILRSPVPLLAVAVPVLALLTWLATRRLLDAPQPARDEQELYWQDAIRAKTLGSLYAVAPLASLFGLAVCSSVLDEAASATALASGQVGPEWSLWVLIGGYLLTAVLALGAVALLFTDRGEADHFRARLWPTGPRTGAPSGSWSGSSSQEGRA